MSPQKTHKKRIQLIEKWVQYKNPSNKIPKELASFGWDYEGEPFKINKDHLISILERYLKNQLKESDVYKWADFIEVRDDAEYSDIEYFIFTLANPDINGQLSPLKAKKHLKELKGK
jgi:hypothetical protein